MTNMLLAKLKAFFERATDELIGGWYNADDGNGSHTAWGYGLEFKPSGEGMHHTWGMGDPAEGQINGDQPFQWSRIDRNTIIIRFPKDKQWEKIEYAISDWIGPYKVKYKKLTQKGKEEFWCSPEPLYKQR